MRMPHHLLRLCAVLQCNLKQTVGAFDNQQLLPGFVDLRGGDLHIQEELLSLQRLKESVVSPALSQRPVITLASLLPVSKTGQTCMPTKAIVMRSLLTVPRRVCRSAREFRRLTQASKRLLKSFTSKSVRAR